MTVKQVPVNINEPEVKYFDNKTYEEDVPEETNDYVVVTSFWTKRKTLIIFLTGLILGISLMYYIHDKKYGEMENALDRNTEISRNIGYNNSVILGKVEENAKLGEEYKQNTDLLVDKIQELMGKKEQKVINVPGQ